ncbi:integrase, catalytic region, zinc finger, CCHC-type containing protein [Tanacetum coccineum]
MKNKIATSRKWQKWFDYQPCFNWSPKSKTIQSTPSVSKSSASVRTKVKTPVTTQKWVAKLSTLPYAFVSCDSGTVHFGNDHFATITGYGDYVQGKLTICHVYYVEGLGYNLFLIGQLCDGELEVAFRSNTCYVRNLEGGDLLTGSRYLNLYTISIFELAASSPVCLMSKATSTKSWLWHRRLSHLNFGTINQLTSKDLVDGIPKFKYDKDYLCSAYEKGKSKKASFPPKLVPSTESKFELLHMDLCGPMRNRSIVHTRKMKPKADIGIFIGYSESSCGFCIYNRRTKKIMDTIHVEFDELTVMASECNNSGPGFKCSNFQDSSEDLSVPLKIDLDNLFGPLYEEYYATSTPKVSDNSAANTLDNKDTPSSSLIFVEEDEAPQIVSSSTKLVATESNTPVSHENADEFV